MLVRDRALIRLIAGDLERKYTESRREVTTHLRHARTASRRGDVMGHGALAALARCRFRNAAVDLLGALQNAGICGEHVYYLLDRKFVALDNLYSAVLKRRHRPYQTGTAAQITERITRRMRERRAV